MFGDTSSAGLRVSDNPYNNHYIMCWQVRILSTVIFIEHYSWPFDVLSSSHRPLTAITKPQFAMGPQKCVVRTPVGEFHIAWALAARLLACFVAHMPAVTSK